MGTKVEDRYRKPARGALHVRQVPELSIAFRRWWLENRDRWEYMGDRIGLEGLISAILVDFLDLAPGEKASLLGRNLPRVEQMERDWIAEMDRAISAGEIEPYFPYKPIRRSQVPAKKNDVAKGHVVQESRDKKKRNA